MWDVIFSRIAAAGGVRRLTICVLLTTPLCLISGCAETRIGGQTGVSVDSQGRPVIVIAVCKGEIDSLVLFDDKHPTDRSKQDVPIGEWISEHPVKEMAEVPLGSPPEGWTVEKQAGSLREGVGYAAFANDKRRHWEAAQLNFSTETLRSLTPSEVMYQRGTVARASFRSAACS